MEIKFEGIAMSKKKTTKVLTSEEKRRSRKYRFLLGFFIALNLTFFIFYDSLATFLVTSFYKTEYLYIYFDLSAPFVLFCIFFLLNFLFSIQLFESAGKSASSFIDFISQKNHKNLIRIICIFVISFCIFVSFICILHCRVVADDTSITESFLIKKDVTLFTYDSADHVRVYVVEESLRYGDLHHVYVDVSDGGETHTFLSEGFGRDHKRILEFLENFDREIITADNTDMEEILTTSEEQQRLLEQIFNEYS